jgi:hypothetical protein
VLREDPESLEDQKTSDHLRDPGSFVKNRKHPQPERQSAAKRRLDDKARAYSHWMRRALYVWPAHGSLHHRFGSWVADLAGVDLAGATEQTIGIGGTDNT